MDDTPFTGMPRGLALLWGEARTSTRGPKPGLSIEQVVEAAMGIADEDGLAQVSMARVAKRLGFTTMSLYRCVEGKDDLLTLMFDAACGPPPELADLGADWRHDLERWAWTLRDRYVRHPWGLEIPITGPVMTPNQFGWLEIGLQALEATRLDDEEKASVVLLLSGFVRNEAQLAADLGRAEQRWNEVAAEAEAEAPGKRGPRAGERGHPGAEQASPSVPYEAIALRLLDAERFPSVVRALRNGLFEGDEPYGEAEFEFGLTRVLDGIGVLVDERARSRRTASARTPRRSAPSRGDTARRTRRR